ncbi:MAG: LTA synthase family protein [Deltaproteobacteria bacterium]|nr:LTA synthase family protein [Deltaproteobacteria bacterium]
MIHVFYRTTLLLISFFFIHRLLTFSDLVSSSATDEMLVSLQLFLTGSMSDLWSAVLGALALLFAEYVLARIISRSAGQYVRNSCLTAILLILSLHSNYVAFFQAPLNPLHLSYLTDPAFLRGNLASAWEAKVFLNLIAGLLCWQLIHLWTSKKPAARTGSLLRAGLLMALALSLHGLHNRYKVQWFVPEPLRYNLFEGLIIDLSSQRQVPALSAAEELKLREIWPPSEEAGRVSSSLSFHLRNHEPLSPESADGGPLAKLPEQVRLAREAGMKPLIITYLMESFRYYDAGVYGGSAPSLTPQFDQLAQSGLLFHQAWSVSNVTRGGQEAVWCGYLSAAGRSAMRERHDLPLRCIPDYPESGHNFWIHGGEGRFDNQEWFWKKHGVRSLISRADLPETLPASGWGIGDLSLAEAAVKAIRQMHQSTAESILNGMILTVSNHIPWELPADAPEHVRNFPFAGKHPGERTVHYADAALGHFVAGLKDAGLWEQTVLIIIGDHGIRVPAFQQYPTEINGDELNSRIGFLISGGMSETQLRQQPVAAQHWRQPCSQADLATFLAELLGIRHFLSMGQSLFLPRRLTPVMSDLGSRIFFPESSVSISSSGTADLLRASREHPEALFYRSFLEFLNRWNLQNHS